MKADIPTNILNLYEWLPAYGETSISFIASKLTFDVEIYYDSDVAVESKKILRFHHARSFSVSSVPGYDTSAIDVKAAIKSGAVIQYEESEAADGWTKCTPWSETPIRHYVIHFESSNKKVEVFACSCELLAS